MRTSHENEDKLISSNEDSIEVGVPEIIKTLYVLFLHYDVEAFSCKWGKFYNVTWSGLELGINTIWKNKNFKSRITREKGLM